MSEDTIELMMEFLLNLEKIVKSFNSSLEFLDNLMIGEARVKLAEVMRLEEKGKEVRTKLEELIVSARLEASLKEDLLNFILRVDAIGDRIKEASRELTILPFLETPSEIRKGIVEISKISIKSVQQLISAARKTIEGDLDKALEDIKLLSDYEEKADALDISNRGLLLSLSERLKPFTISILIHDLNKDLEDSVDTCQVAGEYLRLIILAWLKQI
ncbi:MAG: DUF47 family protein [Thermosphaera sp.]